MPSSAKNKDKAAKDQNDRTMQLTIKNFGPISSGKVDLKPLTIFIGPNNSGKSYLAILIHSFYKSISKGLKTGMKDIGITNIKDPTLKKFDKILDKLVTLKPNEAFTYPANLISQIVNDKYPLIHSSKLSNEIMESFSSPLTNLVGGSSSSFIFTASNNRIKSRFALEGGELKITKSNYISKDIVFSFAIQQEGWFAGISPDNENNKLNINVNYKWKNKPNQYNLICSADAIINYLQMLFNDYLIKSKDTSYYLPAARSALIQSYKFLTSRLWKSIPIAMTRGIETVDLPNFSGVVSSFLSEIAGIITKPKKYHKLAEDLETDLLKGRLMLHSPDNMPLSDIIYKAENLEIPLSRTSSAIQEIAPLILYLKYIITDRTANLIIEEPEAHLHPANQRILAQYLAKLIRQGLNIIITTHSDYLLEQLASFVMMSGVDEKSRVKKYNRGKDDYLLPEEVGVYAFKRQKRGNAFKIEPVEVTQETGISMDEFSDVLNELYEETSNIRIDLQEK
ncbi:MAG TPA: AAA family ATPase [bacterium]|nr:AAA family ATPase [bacterium]